MPLQRDEYGRLIDRVLVPEKAPRMVLAYRGGHPRERTVNVAIGERVGTRVALASEVRRDSRVWVLARCDCGRTLWVRADNFRRRRCRCVVGNGGGGQ
jgi:hypothetical protein